MHKCWLLGLICVLYTFVPVMLWAQESVEESVEEPVEKSIEEEIIPSTPPFVQKIDTRFALQTNVRAVTRPSADVTLSFIQPGLIFEVKVKEGDFIKENAVVAKLDDAVELAQLAQIEAESNDTTQIQASEASLAQKRVDLKKLQRAAELNAATQLEVEHAQLNVKIAELSLQLAKFEHEQARRKLAEMKTLLKHMQIKCPINGVVENVFRETGESANALEEIVQIVQIDPLWIDASVPMVQARSLNVGQNLPIEFPGPKKESVQGQIIFIAAVADAASETLKVRIKVPNKTNRPAGEQVRVICSDK